MTKLPDIEQSENEWPALYHIVVGGRLDGSWSERMAGLTVTPVRGAESKSRTVLYGPIRDQAELSGVLNALYDLHLQLLSVKAMGAVELGDALKSMRVT